MLRSSERLTGLLKEKINAGMGKSPAAQRTRAALATVEYGMVTAYSYRPRRLTVLGPCRTR